MMENILLLNNDSGNPLIRIELKNGMRYQVLIRYPFSIKDVGIALIILGEEIMQDEK